MPLHRRANAFIAPPIPWRAKSRHCCVGAPLRRAFSAVTGLPRREQFTVPCRSNGSITVDVYHASSPASPVVIYLPPGPVVHSSSEDEDLVISILREKIVATIVRINYRASSVHQYPTPYHDVLFGFDWIRDTLLRDEFKRPYLARLGVCGELIGGSLATMLAMTECRPGESRIGAAAVNNPLVDWVFAERLPAVDPSELPEPFAAEETAFPAEEDPMSAMAQIIASKPSRKLRKRSPKAPPLTAWQRYSDNFFMPTRTLVVERDVLFRKPEDYFDRFASPIHFFRSPHAQMVLPQTVDMSASRQPDELLDIETQMSIDHYASVGKEALTAAELPILTRCRAYTRNYPLTGPKTSLSDWNITTGSESPLSDQATELAKMLRRSIARHTLKSHAGRIRWHNASEKQTYEEAAQERVHLNTHAGIGLWNPLSGNKDWRQHVHDISAWMKDRLEVGKFPSCVPKILPHRDNQQVL